MTSNFMRLNFMIYKKDEVFLDFAVTCNYDEEVL